jgi:hypothetical protein
MKRISAKMANYSSTTEAREKLTQIWNPLQKNLNGTDVHVTGKPSVVFKRYKLE